MLNKNIIRHKFCIAVIAACVNINVSYKYRSVQKCPCIFTYKCQGAVFISCFQFYVSSNICIKPTITCTRYHIFTGKNDSNAIFFYSNSRSFRGMIRPIRASVFEIGKGEGFGGGVIGGRAADCCIVAAVNLKVITFHLHVADPNVVGGSFRKSNGGHHAEQHAKHQNEA
ncbi:MAG: hypothetical protein IJ508_06035 [Oscillospiraceae bacterium]|nr:hypothetical protein [Oscillospiraceae bacterium]